MPLLGKSVPVVRSLRYYCPRFLEVREPLSRVDEELACQSI